MEESRHVIDWSTAAVEWSSDGYELVVALVPAATTRLATAIADRIGEHLGEAFVDGDGSVVPIEPDGEEPAHLLLTSPALLGMDPNWLRQLMNAVADQVGNEITGEESRDAALIARWVDQLRS